MKHQTNESLRAGYEAGAAPGYSIDESGSLIITRQNPGSSTVGSAQSDPEAFDLGMELADAWQAVRTASMSEYKADVERFDRIATEINRRYGPVVGLSTDEDAFQLRRSDRSDENDAEA